MGHNLPYQYAGYNQEYYSRPAYNQGYNVHHPGYPYQQYLPQYEPHILTSQYGYSSQNAYSPRDPTGGIEHYKPGYLLSWEIYCYYNLCDIPDTVYPEHF